MLYTIKNRTGKKGKTTMLRKIKPRCIFIIRQIELQLIELSSLIIETNTFKVMIDCYKFILK